MPNDPEHEIITAGYHQLAKRLHPDKGGTAEQMGRLNAARDHLKWLLAAPKREAEITPATPARVVPTSVIDLVRRPAWWTPKAEELLQRFVQGVRKTDPKWDDPATVVDRVVKAVTKRIRRAPARRR